MDPFDDPPPNRKLNKPSAESTHSGNCELVPRQANVCENVESNYAFNSQTNSGNCSTEPQKNNISYFPRTENDNPMMNLNENSVINCRNVAIGDNSRGEQSAVSSSSSCRLVPGTEVESHKPCLDDSSNVYNISIPSTSHASEHLEAIGCKESRKRPSSLKLNQPNLGIEDNSSDTGNDDYSLGSEDGCIYTYRGGEHLADLPSSFFSLDMGLPLDKHLPIPANFPLPQQLAPNARDQGSRTSSPDMDFLEMDFDPGPSCDADTSDDSSPVADIEVGIDLPDENEPVFVRNTPDCQVGVRQNVQTYNNPAPASVNVSSQGFEIQCISVPSTSRGLSAGDNSHETKNIETYGPYITHVNASGQKILVRRTMSHWPLHSAVSLHLSSGDLISPKEMMHSEDEHPESLFAYQINQGENSANMSSSLYHLNMAKKLMSEKTKLEEGNSAINKGGEVSSKTEGEGGEITVCVEPPRTMVWSEQEACERQVTQIATSACGATAVVNVFIVLGVPVNIERINAAVGTRQRANNAPLPRYLLSRSVAGCTAADLVNGIQRASDGLVTARFFPTYPERAMSLSHWLADWISVGAVPILTLNLQMGCEGETPDAWHHQMVFGVSSRGVYLCNPVECVPESTLWPKLTSPSILLVRTRDALARFTTSTDLTPLMFVPDQRFHTFNVVGQVANAIREWRATGWSEHGTRTRHIRIPASYQAGITVAALTGSEAHRRLMHAASLPLLAPHCDATNR